jgi:hypothetical protein
MDQPQVFALEEGGESGDESKEADEASKFFPDWVTVDINKNTRDILRLWALSASRRLLVKRNQLMVYEPK